MKVSMSCQGSGHRGHALTNKGYEMSVSTNPVLAGLVAHFNNDENKALASQSRELIAILSPEKTSGSAYSFFYGREDNDEETTNLLDQYARAEEAVKRIKESLEAKRAGVASGSDISVEDAKSRFDELQPAIKELNSTRRQMIKTAEMLGTSDEDMKEFEEALVSAGKAKRAGASGGQRVRWETLSVNGEDVKNFTEAAKVISGVTTADLTAALLKATGVSHWETARDNDPNVSFEINDKDGKSFTVAGVLDAPKDAPAKSDENTDEGAEPTDEEIAALDNETDEFDV